MKVGIIGLGKMGEALAYRMIKAGISVVGYDIDEHARKHLCSIGGNTVEKIEDFVHKDIHVFWLMVPQGVLVDRVINELKPCLQKGDIIVDGGNSKFIDSMQRARELALFDISFLDCGTSGGVRGREDGFCLMVGGDSRAYQAIEHIVKAVAVPHGYGLLGPSGAGHYVKMVHNGIEYALLQAYAEGFHLLRDGMFKDSRLNLEKVAEIWNHGSVIRSWILELVQEIMNEDQDFNGIAGNVEATGMGKWTVEQGHKSGVPVTLIEDSLKIRTWSQETGGNYATKLVALLRNKFGGHGVTKK